MAIGYLSNPNITDLSIAWRYLFVKTISFFTPPKARYARNEAGSPACHPTDDLRRVDIYGLIDKCLNSRFMPTTTKEELDEKLNLLLDTIKEKIPNADLDLVRLAYDFALKSHGAQNANQESRTSSIPLPRLKRSRRWVWIPVLSSQDSCTMCQRTLKK